MGCERERRIAALREWVADEIVTEDGWAVVDDPISDLAVRRSDGVVWEFCATVSDGSGDNLHGVAWEWERAVGRDQREPMVIAMADDEDFWVFSQVDLGIVHDRGISICKHLSWFDDTHGRRWNLYGYVVDRGVIEALCWS